MSNATNNIIKWIEKSRNEEDYFDKFTYGFFALNAMYSEFHTTSERNAIKELFDISYEPNIDEFKKILHMPEFDYFCTRKPIRNMKFDPANPDSGYPDTLRDTENIREKHPRRSNRSMLMILYQIRCNLFHGNKAFNYEYDQEVMKNASELLLRYNDIFSKRLKNRDL